MNLKGHDTTQIPFKYFYLKYDWTIQFKYSVFAVKYIFIFAFNVFLVCSLWEQKISKKNVLIVGIPL